MNSELWLEQASDAHTHTRKLSIGVKKDLSEILLQSLSLPSFTLSPEEVVGV